MPTVHVPGVGDVERKYVWWGLGAAGSIAAWYWWRQRSAAPAADGTVDPNAIDPLTGLPFSAEQSGNTGYVNPNPVTSVDTRTGNGVNDNQAWAADVIDKLGNIGQDPSFVGAVLGKYLASQPLTLEEAAVVRMAWALSGKPPQGPANFTLATGTSTPGGGTGNGDPYANSPHPEIRSGVFTTAPGWTVANTVKALNNHGWVGTYATLVALNPGLPNDLDKTKRYWVKAGTYKLR